MPRIPLPETAKVQSPSAVYPHLSGAPGMSFGMEDARSLAEAARSAGKLNQIGDAMIDFAVKEAESRNSLATVRARNIFKAAQQELEQKMMANPGSFDQFEKWGAESDKKTAEALKPVLDEMTADHRKRFEPEMENWQLDAANARNRSIIKAKVAHNTALFNTELETAARNYDINSFEYLMDQNEGILFHPDQRAAYENKFYQDADFYAARNAAQQDPSATLGELEKMTGGKFDAYASMDPGKRTELIRYCRAQDASRRANENRQLVEKLHNGEIISIKKIEEQFKERNSDADIEQLQTQRKIIENFNAGKERAQEKQQRLAEKQQRLAEKHKAEQKQKEINRLVYDIMTLEFSPIPDEKLKQVAELNQLIAEKYAGDGETFKMLTRELDNSVEQHEKKSAAYRQSPIYKYSLEYIDNISKDDLYVYEKAGDISRYSDDTVASHNKSELLRKFDLLFRLNPNLSRKEAIDFIDQTRDFITEQQISDLFAAWMKISDNVVNKYRRRKKNTLSAAAERERERERDAVSTDQSKMKELEK